jgi:release factor glutamine methyltransferase
MRTAHIDAALAAARQALNDAHVVDPEREAATLLQFVLDKPRTFLIAHPGYELTEDQAAAYALAIGRRTEREPLQYITGRQEFYGLEFDVEPEVLIPRPETELLVEAAIALLQDSETPTFVEVGVGSGCISVSILHSLPTARALAIDVSTYAISVARRNAVKHNVLDRLQLVEGNIFDDIDGRFHLIASNPPYILTTDIETLEPEVRDFEPHLALDGGPDGLDVIRRIVAEAPQYLNPGGHVLLEIGINEADAVTALFEPNLWIPPDLVPDLRGIPRLVKARLKDD